MSRKARVAVALLLLSGALGYGAYAAFVATENNPPAADDTHGCSIPPPEHPAGDLDLSDRVSVPINRGPEVADPFQGDVHPLLRQQAVDVTARWVIDPRQIGDAAFFRALPPAVQACFLGFAVSVPTRTYTERDFSRFLPAAEPGAVGQMWALDTQRVAAFLRQFHTGISMRIVAKGRRPGPDGAFAVLRAVSPSHLDILFRVHAEYDVRPASAQPGTEAWYSPSGFLGRMVVNRATGTVEFFQLGVPTDTYYNVHLTLATGRPEGEFHGWMHVDLMELTGGNRWVADQLSWAEQIDEANAYERLSKVFYRFKEIDWVPFEGSQALARARNKPIFAVVPLGSLEDQTC